MKGIFRHGVSAYDEITALSNKVALTGLFHKKNGNSYFYTPVAI